MMVTARPLQVGAAAADADCADCAGTASAASVLIVRAATPSNDADTGTENSLRESLLRSWLTASW
jgi:hypothetical protein